MKRTNRILSILLAVIMVVCMLPVSVFAADAATIVVNSEVIRYEETTAEVSFYPTSGDFTADWQYYYLVSQQNASMTADDVKNSGTAYDFDESIGVATFEIKNLAEGVKYIHIMLVQKNDATQFSNVLKLTIPEYVPLTIVPSADGCELDGNNTITVAVGTTVTFTTSESGCGMDYKEGTTVGPDLEFVGDEGYVRTATFTELGTYTIVASINYKTAECTVVVVDEFHQHSYASVWLFDETCHWRDCSCGGKFETAAHTPGVAATTTTPQTCTICGYEIAPVLTDYTLTLDYSIVTESGVEIGTGLSDQNVGCPAGDVVDLSGYWRDDSLEVTGSDGKTYYFGGFVENSNGNGTLLYSTTMNSNKTLYANWVFDKQITVILDTQSGTLPYRKVRIAEKYAEISEMNSLHKPVRAGYDFVGWSVENDGVADSGDTYISDGWPIYAVWQTYMPSYDDNWAPPAPGTTVEIGGDYDAVRISDGVIGKIIDNGNEVIVKFPDGTSGTLTDSALIEAKDNLQDGESLQIAIKNVGSEVLPDSLTEQGPYGGRDWTIDTSIFKATGIENIEDRLKTLGLINGNTDSSVTEDEFEYLYHYLTTDELMALRAELNESAHFEHHQKAVEWLDEMIERDGVELPFTYNNLLDYADFTDEQIAVLTRPGGISGSDYPTLGELRELGLTLEQMQLLQGNAKALREDETFAEFQAKYDALLAWLDDAIAHKELEALYAQMDEWIAEADAIGAGAYVAGNPIEEVKQAVQTMTTAELEKFLEKANEAKNYSISMELYELAAFLSDELQAREASDTPTYVQVDGTSDGINPIFIGAVDVNIGAVKSDGTTTPIAIKADRSDAVDWSTNIGSAAVEEMIGMLMTEDVVSNIKAYKVLDNGTLEARGVKVVQNADGTLTLSAMSDGNSTYVFLYEPAKVDVDDNTNTDVPSSPQTGDTSNMWLWIALLFVSGAGLAGTTLYGRKRRTN